MPVSLPVLQNPVTTYSGAKQNHQKDYVTVALINPKAFILLDRFFGSICGKRQQKAAASQPFHFNLHINVNNRTSYKDVENWGENSVPASYKGINNL